ncbi:MAG: hypothetical protein NVSMB19_08310 [Vulcanimicrobiaceae bacterium]
MLDDYRTWLAAELDLLGNASHHAYAFGQANMAKRAIERLDAVLAGRVALLLEAPEAAALLAALEGAPANATEEAQLATVRERLRRAVEARTS